MHGWWVQIYQTKGQCIVQSILCSCTRKDEKRTKNVKCGIKPKFRHFHAWKIIRRAWKLFIFVLTDKVDEAHKASITKFTNSLIHQLMADKRRFGSIIAPVGVSLYFDCWKWATPTLDVRMDLMMIWLQS